MNTTDDELARLMARYPQPMPAQMPTQAQAPMARGGPQPVGAGGGVSPELMQAILGLQGQTQEQGRIAKSRRLADMLRADAGGQMQGRQVGAVYAPPNIANVAANLYSGYKAKQLDDDADVRAGNMSAQSQDAMRRYFEALAGRRTAMGLPHMGDEGE